MNCHHFQNVIDDLSRGALMDARAREEAIAHTSVCARCAARLGNERTLTAGLRALASSEEQMIEAPARVESALLEAFRARHSTTTQPESVAHIGDAKVRRERVRRAGQSLGWLPRWAQGAAVAAASMLVVFGLYGLLREQSARPIGEIASNDEPVREQLAGRADSNAAQSSSNSESKAVALLEANNEDQAVAIEASSPRRSNRLSNARRGQQLASFNDVSARTQNSKAGYTAPQEITTDYFPIAGGGQLAPGDAGHVVRVELPRTALASFGLPVNADRTEARVKADVLMGEDGIARAIRFVR